MALREVNVWFSSNIPVEESQPAGGPMIIRNRTFELKIPLQNSASIASLPRLDDLQVKSPPVTFVAVKEEGTCGRRSKTI